ncbi:hypothetical protein BN7_392 [Wickerhamomyces ciferrii]|uniref:FHA domain-containing protein n=1 Tax=Wickerhamomyces ciferrii (strain ATCC 14091 / BCRC 22168 / CBS 111 / JCM 3599 / NBRC 0793 / NRRL Y-1031 F-60-10) TaxID=1206466 RepID=K0KI87_WICCF|nr:uncharacterized protein BN7_392 [Wickerhamomyces ciferrii]CCH40858.1 hypothetical protein BN7_392 [Wickerhamomyces ciferrii]
MSSSTSAREERLRSHEKESRGNWPEKNYRDRPSAPRYNNDESKYNNDRTQYKPYNRDQGYERPYSRDHKQNQEQPPQPPKEKPNFKPSGLLAKESNNIKGTQLKYTEPEDSINPTDSPIYYLFIFKKNSKIPQEYKLNNKSYHLIGRDETIVDLSTDDESCSKQHAVIQFRSRPIIDEYGSQAVQIKPYLIDLESSNGTFLNNEEIPTSRFIELQGEDTIRFGDSETDHVLVIGD